MSEAKSDRIDCRQYRLMWHVCWYAKYFLVDYNGTTKNFALLPYFQTTLWCEQTILHLCLEMYFNSVTYFHLFLSFHPLVLCAYNLKSTFKMGYMLLLHKHKCEQMMVHIEYWTVITEAGIQNIICWRSSLIKEYLIWRKVTSVCHICQAFTKVIHICEIAISIWTDSI